MINLNIDSNKYKDLCLILHNISSWPNDWISFIEGNKKILNNYYREEKRINLMRNQNDNFDPLTENKYQNNYNKFIEEFKELVSNKKYKILGIHATRLMDYEVNNILLNGLDILSEDLLQVKLKLLLNNELIDKDEYEWLNSHNMLNSKQKESRIGLIYFTIGHQIINTKIENHNFYYLLNNYGGEVINMKNKDNYKLFEKLNYYSKPYFIVCSLNASVLNNVLDIYENMVEYYLKIDDKKFWFDVRVKNKKTVSSFRYNKCG